MLQQRNQIIADLYNSKDFNDCINKMEPEHLREDLKQEVMVVLLGKEPEVICGLEQRGELRWYVVRVVLNMVCSNNSNFTKMYRRTFVNSADAKEVDCSFQESFYDSNKKALVKKQKLNDVLIYKNGAELDIKIRRELSEQAVLRFINTELYWYDRTIVQMYMKFGNYRAIQTETKIPWESCYKTVRRVVDRIQKEVLNAPE